MVWVMYALSYALHGEKSSHVCKAATFSAWFFPGGIPRSAFHSNGLEGRVLKKSGDVCFTLEATSRGVAYYSPPSLFLSDRIRGGSYVLGTLPTCANKHLLSVKGIIGSGSMVLAPINIGHQFEFPKTCSNGGELVKNESLGGTFHF